MRPVSAAFLASVRGSHRMVSRARVLTTFCTGTAPLDPGVALEDCAIPITSGDVRSDAAADVRSTLAMVTTAAWSMSGLLTPYGNEVFVERGIDYGGGRIEWVSLGYHRIEDVEQDDAPEGPVRIAAKDRMAGLVAARLLAPVQFAAADLVGDVVEQLVTEVYPEVVIEWDDSTNLVPLGRSLICEEDRYGFLDELVTSHGKDWFWDYRGVLVIRTAPDSTVPVFEVNGGEDGVLVALRRKISREGVYNAVVASGEGADTANPVRAAVVDNNPSSRTYWSGAFGKVPRFYTSPFITTTAQAQSAAEALLRKVIGLPYSVDFTAVPNPALESLDSVRITTTEGHETHVIESLTVPLTYDQPLVAATREQTLITLGVP